MPPARITHHCYGKERVRMMKVVRGRDRHEVRDLEVSISLEGDFAEAYASGDNDKVLPTDSMKNAVYALGREHAVESIESFAADLAGHFTDSVPPVTAATVSIAAASWDRVVVDGRPHPHAFLEAGPERATCSVTVADGRRHVESGLSDLVLMKTTASGFAGFSRDRYTTLRDTDDRVLRTAVTATWSCDEPVEYEACRHAVRDALISAFVDHYSPSVQYTLQVMAERALAAFPGLGRIHLELPNLHCLLVDLSPFGLENDNEVFLPVDEPHGTIQATFERQGG